MAVVIVQFVKLQIAPRKGEHSGKYLHIAHCREYGAVPGVVFPASRPLEIEIVVPFLVNKFLNLLSRDHCSLQIYILDGKTCIDPVEIAQWNTEINRCFRRIRTVIGNIKAAIICFLVSQVKSPADTVNSGIRIEIGKLVIFRVLTVVQRKSNLLACSQEVVLGDTGSQADTIRLRVTQTTRQ